MSQLACPVTDKAAPNDSDAALTLSAEHGLVKQDEYFGKIIASEDASRYTRIVYNDFVYNDRTTKQSVYGTIKRLAKYQYGVVSPLYKCFRFNATESSIFWDAYFESGLHNSGLRELINEGARAGRFNISIHKFFSTSVLRPSHKEQQKIADCLASIDDLIDVETSKLDALKKHKKGLMQVLFPQEGETVPMVRFPEYRGIWEKKNLSSCIQLISGLHLSPDEYAPNGEIPYFTGPSDFTNNSSGLKKWTKKSFNTAQTDDILITVKGSGVGELWYLTLPCVAIGRQLMAIRSKNCLNQFVYHILTAKTDCFKSLATGNLIPGLSRKDILDIELSLPSPAEQQKITEHLTSIDELAALHAQKLFLLKVHKKSLLQQLFPPINEAK